MHKFLQPFPIFPNETDTPILCAINDKLTQDQKNQIINDTHQKYLHCGTNSTIQILKNNNYKWKGLSNDVRSQLSKCEQCCQFNPTQSIYHNAKSVEACKINNSWEMDIAIIGKDNNEYENLLTIVDVYSGFLSLYALKTKTAQEIMLNLNNNIKIFGSPIEIIFDNSKEFSSNIIGELARNYQIKLHLSTSYRPESHAQVERSNRTIKEAMFKYLQGNLQQWSSELPKIQIILNSRISERTNLSPYFLMFGTNPNLIEDYTAWEVNYNNIEEELKKRINNLNTLNKTVRPLAFETSTKYHKKANARLDNSRNIAKQTIPINSTVWLANLGRNKKSDPKFDGPFKVTAIDLWGKYVLSDSTEHALSEHYPIDQLKIIPNSTNQILEIREYIKAIKDHRKINGEIEYLVLFEN